MFAAACKTLRETIYGLNGLSQVGPNQVNGTNATGFMIAPGILATAAHFCHIDNDLAKPVHQAFEAIRCPDIGQNMVTASLLAEDVSRDLALLKLSQSPANDCVTLEPQRAPNGTSCGSLGFPLASIVFSQSGRMFNLVERFQGAFISAYGTLNGPNGRQLGYYETDSLMYGGSSGCPGFLVDGRVFGMHVASATEPAGPQSKGARLAISIWVPAQDIISFARSHGITL